MALARTRRPFYGKRGFTKKVKTGPLIRVAAPWLPNVAGYRYVRDQQKPGLVSKLIRR